MMSHMHGTLTSKQVCQGLVAQDTESNGTRASTLVQRGAKGGVAACHEEERLMWGLTWIAHGRPYGVGMLVIHSSQDNRHDEALQSSEGLQEVNKNFYIIASPWPETTTGMLYRSEHPHAITLNSTK